MCPNKDNTKEEQRPKGNECVHQNATMYVEGGQERGHTRSPKQSKVRAWRLGA